jgi:hypothetical protein
VKPYQRQEGWIQERWTCRSAIGATVGGAEQLGLATESCRRNLGKVELKLGCFNARFTRIAFLVDCWKHTCVDRMPLAELSRFTLVLLSKPRSSPIRNETSG